MGKKEDQLNLINNDIGILEGYVSYAKKLHENLAYVENILEQSRWRKIFYETMPQDIENELPDKIIDYSRIAHESIYTTFKGMGEIKFSHIPSSTGVSATPSTNEYSYALFKSKKTDPDSNKWANNVICSYKAMEFNNDKIDNIKNKINILSKEISDQFIKSVDSYKRVKNGIGDIFEAALSMRTVLDHTKGEIFFLSHKAKKANKSLQWETMAEDLSINGPDSRECLILKGQKEKYDSLFLSFTNIGKNRIKIDLPKFEDLFIEYIDHLYITLNLIEL